MARTDSQREHARRKKQSRKLRDRMHQALKLREFPSRTTYLWLPYAIDQLIGYHAGRLFAMRESLYDRRGSEWKNNLETNK